MRRTSCWCLCSRLRVVCACVQKCLGEPACVASALHDMGEAAAAASSQQSSCVNAAGAMLPHTASFQLCIASVPLISPYTRAYPCIHTSAGTCMLRQASHLSPHPLELELCQQSLYPSFLAPLWACAPMPYLLPRTVGLCGCQCLAYLHHPLELFGILLKAPGSPARRPHREYQPLPSSIGV